MARPGLIVADASALVEVLTGGPAAATVAARFVARGVTLHAPHVVDVEVGHAIRRLHRLGAFDAARGEQALGDLGDLRLRRYPHDPLLTRAWELHDNLTFYDAVYVALAESLDATLVTLDARLRSAPGHAATVDVVEA